MKYQSYAFNTKTNECNQKEKRIITDDCYFTVSFFYFWNFSLYACFFRKYRWKCLRVQLIAHVPRVGHPFFRLASKLRKWLILIYQINIKNTTVRNIDKRWLQMTQSIYTNINKYILHTWYKYKSIFSEYVRWHTLATSFWSCLIIRTNWDMKKKIS